MDKKLKRQQKKFEKQTNNPNRFIFKKWYNNYLYYFWITILSFVLSIVLICLGCDLLVNNAVVAGSVLFVFGLILLGCFIYLFLLLIDSIKAKNYRKKFKQPYCKKMYSLRSCLDYLDDEVCILDYKIYKSQLY